jgi:ATP-dependent protease HslVU (ClpYQ) peptidase subunit
MCYVLIPVSVLAAFAGTTASVINIVAKLESDLAPPFSCH